MSIRNIYYNGNIQKVLNTAIEISTPLEMESVLTESNVGLVYKFTGETNDVYINGDLYVVESRK